LGREFGSPPLTPVRKDATHRGKPLGARGRCFINLRRCKECCVGSISGRGFPYVGKAAGVARCGKAARREMWGMDPTATTGRGWRPIIPSPYPLRHEVVRVAVVTAISSVLTAIWQDITRCSATGILPRHASPVTVGCEALGTSASLTQQFSTYGLNVRVATEARVEVATASTEAVGGSDRVVWLTYGNR